MVCFLENSPESIYQYIAISSGTGNADEEKKRNHRQISKIDFICIDVANGYSEHFVIW